LTSHNKVHINIIEQGSLKTVVKIDGVAKNKKDQIEKLYKFVVNNSKEVTQKISSYNYQKRVYETRETGSKIEDKSKLIPVIKIVDQLSSEVSTANNPRKVVTKRSPVKRPVNISPSKAGFVFRRLGDDIIEIPKNTTTSVKIDKLPQYEFFATKDKRNTWAILETTSGLAVVQNAKSKKEAIEDSKQKINESIAKDRDFLPNTIKKNSLPYEYLRRLNQYKTPGKTMTRPAAVKSSTATKTARKVIANRAAKSRPAAKS
jgi:hypothetical protein